MNETDSYRKIEIEPWLCDERYIAVHLLGFTGIHHADGSIVNCPDVETVKQIGRISGMVKFVYGTEPHLDGDCQIFCKIVDALLEYTPIPIATARGQMEAGFEDSHRLSDLEIAWLDYNIRENYAEEARCYDDPWLQRITVSCDPSHFVTEYFERMHPNEAVSE